MRDGRLEAIFRRWGVWNEDQARLYARLDWRDGSSAGLKPRPTDRDPGEQRGDGGRVGRGATLCAGDVRARPASRSCCRACRWRWRCCSAALIAAGRVYGGRPLQRVLTAYVEVIRGTPLLLQLFVIYFGLAAVIELPAFVAALLGLALNYAAYESEIYRGALLGGPGRSARGGADARTSVARRRSGWCVVRRRSVWRSADDQRLRRAAQGQLARLGDHRRRTDQADVDLRREHRQLGGSRGALRGAVSACCRSRWRTPRDGSSGDGAQPMSVLEVDDSRSACAAADV